MRKAAILAGLVAALSAMVALPSVAAAAPKFRVLVFSKTDGFRHDSIETGVARGGSMLLDASLMRLCGEEPAVLGIDIKIFEHTRAALDGHPAADGVRLLEADSTSPEAGEATADFLSGADRAVLILDSNHTHDHVLSELRLLAPLLPVGSLVLVADTLVEEFPAGYYANRPWDRGNNPATAVRAFLA